MKPLITYIVLACMVSWVWWLPLYGQIFNLHSLPVIPYHHAVGALGPFAAAFITTAIYHRGKGVMELTIRLCKIRSFVYLAIALLSPFVIAAIAMLINSFITNTSLQLRGLLQVQEFPQFSFTTYFAYNLVFFGIGEEVGWRGFALPHLQARHTALSSAIILTVIWAVWHWPLFFYRPGYTTMSVPGILGWIFSLLTGSILLSWLYNSSRGSLLTCAVFHSCIDIAFTAPSSTGTVSYMGAIITIWGLLTILQFKAKDLSAFERIKHIS